MSLAAPLRYEPDAAPREVDVEIVVPVHNEEAALARSIRRLHAYLSTAFPLSWVITIADNASIDRTWGIACQLAQELPGVRAEHLDEKGRGRALRAVWSASPAAVVAYMDVDLSTDLAGLLPLVAPLLSGHSDLAIGSRLAPGAHVSRGPKRELISRTYNLILRLVLRNGFSDAQCGFKAVRSDVARRLLPLVEDNGWFFDTELLVLAEHNALRIHEVPVDWVDDPDSRVDVVSTAREDLRGVVRIAAAFARGRGRLTGPDQPGTDHPVDGGRWGGAGMARSDWDWGLAIHFAAIGMVSTLAFAVLFAALFHPLGAAGADVIALAVCAVGNLAANRRFTFAARGRGGRKRHYATGLALSLLPLVLTLGSLAALGPSGLGPALAVVTAANVGVSVLRIELLRRWVFRP